MCIASTVAFDFGLMGDFFYIWVCRYLIPLRLNKLASLNLTPDPQMDLEEVLCAPLQA